MQALAAGGMVVATSETDIQIEASRDELNEAPSFAWEINEADLNTKHN